MTLVVDANVAVKWVIDAGAADDRASTLRSESRLIAPSLIVSEIGSALWKAVRRNQVKQVDSFEALRVALLPLDALVPIEELHIRALEIAIALDHPIYDCFYLALAERENAALITADLRLQKSAARMKGIEVRLL